MDIKYNTKIQRIPNTLLFRAETVQGDVHESHPIAQAEGVKFVQLINADGKIPCICIEQ